MPNQNAEEGNADNGRRIQIYHLLQPSDRPLTTEFTMEVMNQIDVVIFSEKEDRRSRRLNLQLPYSGLACSHCKPNAGGSGDILQAR